MKILDLFRKAVPTRAPEDVRALARQNPVPSLRGRWYTMGVPLIAPETQFQASQAMTHPGVYRVVNKIAEAVACVELKARKIPDPDKPPRKIVDSVEKQLQAVLDNPCDEVTPYNFRYWLAANLAVYGNSPVKIGRTWDGKLPNAIYPLRNVATQVVGDKLGRLIAYRFMSGDGPTFDLPTRSAVERNEREGRKDGVVPWASVVAKPGLDILSLDNSPTKAAALPIEVYLLLLQRARETASGHPNKRYIIVVDGQTSPEQEDDINDMMNESRVGGARSGQVGFLSGAKADILDIDNDLSDLHSKIPSDDMMRVLGGIWGVPAQLLGLGGADAAKYAANYIEGRAAFYEDTIVPGYLAPITSGLTRSMCPPGYEIYADLESLEPLRDARMRRMNAATSVNFLRINEKRALFNLPELTDAELAKLREESSPPPPKPPAAPAPKD